MRSYRFGTVARPIGYHINSLTKPFDISTWILLFGSFLSLSIYFRVSFELLGKRLLLETQILSILLEQSQNIVTRCKSLHKEASILLVFWLLLTFLVGNAYKGVLFIFFTTSSFQVVPQTLQEFHNLNYSIWTTNVDV